MATIHPTALVDPGAVLGEGTIVGPYCVIGAGVVMGRENLLRNHVVIEGPTRIGESNVFHPFAAIGTAPQDLKYAGEPTRLEIGDRNTFRESVTVNRGTVGGGGLTTMGSNCLMMAYAHVAHDCHVGDGAIMANCATLAGHVTIGRHAVIGGLTPVHQFARVGDYAFIGGATRVNQDIVPYARMGGVPPVISGANAIGLARRGFTPEAIKAIEEAIRLLFRAGLNTTQAVVRIKESVPLLPEIECLLDFIAHSKRGIQKSDCRSSERG
jgi:UDP-N-acetylglucosamine acyltransferase